ncbi:MAG TPA: autoinducer binding domain-containing protein, partial [Steroidobacteraceae bacterium]
METQYWKYLKAIPHARSGEEVIQLLAPLTCEIGFQCCSYALCTSFPIGNPRIALFSNYPPELHEACSTQSYAKNPLLQHGMRGSSPLIWSDRIFAATQEFWRTARACGFCYGWTQSTFSGNSIVGVLTVARACGRIDSQELHTNSMIMTWLTHSIHLSL